VSPTRIITWAATAVTLLLVAAVAVLWNIQTNDLIFLPAQAEAIDSHITIAGHPQQQNRGTLCITFVDELSGAQANMLTELFERFNPNASIYPVKEIYGPSPPPPAQQQKQLISEMISSKQSAELAAFNALGHPVPGEQVSVGNFYKESKAQGKLRVNDVILKANGQPIRTPQQLRDVIQRLRPGASVSLLVSRPLAKGTRTLHVTIPTVSITGKAAIGILPQLTFSKMPTDLPYKVKIDSGEIGGPSAGLMFTLAIINRLSPSDLTHGYKIAGTGTIDPDGNVGPIGGVKQKVIGAREAGAEYFFVPAYCDPTDCNYKEAKPYAKGITLVPVYTLDQALAYLRHLK
jgi:PDZ domain-containing protein